MDDREHRLPVSFALFTLAAIKVATDAFESGDTNVCDTLDTIIEAIEDFRAAAGDRSRREVA
jgi:hypothetical protein